MKHLYRTISKNECERQGASIGEEFLIKAFYEPIQEDHWCVMLGFFDELKAELVYLFEGTKINILGHIFSLQEGEPFVLPGEEELYLRQKHFLKRDDKCLRGERGAMHHLREFQGKRVTILRGKYK